MQLLLKALLIALHVKCIFSCKEGRLLFSGVTCEDKQKILKIHNQFRQNVATGIIFKQPKAMDMLEMTWDEELAKQAQNWANKCILKHNDVLARVIKKYRAGENMGKTWSIPAPNAYGEKAEWEGQIRVWFNEVYNNKYKGVYSPETGHYTQLVWADSHLVGCGYSYFVSEGQKYSKMYICYYGPGGNIYGIPPYKKGNPKCTQKGTSPSDTYRGLCKKQGFWAVNC